MFIQVVILTGTLTVLPVLAASLPWNDPCNIRPKGFTSTEETETLKFTRECTEGEIRWDYPRGTFNIDFVPHNKAPFKVCLKKRFAFFLTEIYIVVEGKRVAVTLPTEGNDTCLKSHDGEVKLVLVAPKTLFYMTSVDFYMTVA